VRFGIERAARGRLRVSGEVDVFTASALENAIAAELQDEAGELRLDLSNLSFIDGSGIGILVKTARRLGARGRLVLERPGKRIVRVLKLVGFDRISNVRIVGDARGSGSRRGRDSVLPSSPLRAVQDPDVRPRARD
jgi:anti-sigma B factor antagonist